MSEFSDFATGPEYGTNRNKPLNDQIDVLGDVHLGKKFNTNVPIERRGERETLVWKDFERSLMEAGKPWHIQVGDLFDGLIVPNEVVLQAADIYITAAQKNPSTTYVVYAGNHDRSRTEYRKSSFDVFKGLVAFMPHIHVLMDVTEWKMDGLAFIPWHPFTPANELAEQLTGNYEAVFGHWDCIDFGGDNHNLIPLKELQGKTSLVVTGHEHNAKEFDKDGIHVVITGSMQPYSHAEDAVGEFYVTLTPEEYEERSLSEDLSDRNLRFVLKEGEVMPAVEALSVSCKKVTEEKEEVDINVDFDAFNLPELLTGSLVEAGVNETFRSRVEEKFGELRAE